MREGPVMSLKWNVVGLSMLVVGLAGCSPLGSTKVPESVIASCVAQSGFSQGTQINVEHAFKTDGMNARVRPSVDIDAAAARTINGCIELAVMGRSVKYSASGFAEPRVSAPIQAATAVAGATPMTKGKPAATARAAAVVTHGKRACRMQMVGGSGYVCKPI